MTESLKVIKAGVGVTTVSFPCFSRISYDCDSRDEPHPHFGQFVVEREGSKEWSRFRWGDNDYFIFWHSE